MIQGGAIRGLNKISAEHIAKALHGFCWKTCTLAMYTAYFDASGDIHNAEALALAGFIGGVDQWIEWENEWLQRLKQDNLSCFHRTELASLDKLKRERLFEDLSAIIRAHGFQRFAVAVINDDLRSLTSEADRKQWHINAYSYAGLCGAVEMKQYMLSFSGHPFPQLIFEDGDTGRGELGKLLCKAGYPEPIFKPKRDRVLKKSGIIEKGVVPLQAADLYAYDIFSRARDVVQGKPASRNFAAGINPIIEGIPGRSGVITSAHIKFMAEGMSQMDSDVIQTSVKIDVQTFNL